nr:unnamed protein product [Callosobruchus analis]
MSSIHSQSQQAVAMDVDSPSGGGGGAGSSGGAPGTLKRCSSAPMINEANAAMTTTNGSSTSRYQIQKLGNIRNCIIIKKLIFFKIYLFFVILS